MAHRQKIKALVQTKAGVVLGIDGRDDGAQAQLRRGFNQRGHEQLAHAAPALRRGHVDGILDRKLVALAVVIMAERTPAQHLARVVRGHEDGKLLLGVLLEPAHTVIERARLVIVRGGGVEHGVV